MLIKIGKCTSKKSVMIRFCSSQQKNTRTNVVYLRTSIYLKIRLVVYMVQDELRNKSTGIIHNEIIFAVGRLTVDKFGSIG